MPSSDLSNRLFGYFVEDANWFFPEGSGKTTQGEEMLISRLDFIKKLFFMIFLFLATGADPKGKIGWAKPQKAGKDEDPGKDQ